MSNYKISYDDFADVLYIVVKKAKATTTIMDDNFIAIRKIGNDICGVTIDGYKDRHEDHTWKNSHITKYLPELDLSELPSV